MDIAWEEMQALQNKPTFLHHLNPEWTLYIDVDSSAEFGVGVMYYQVDGNPSPEQEDAAVPVARRDESLADFVNSTSWLKRAKNFPHDKIRIIGFASHALTRAKSRYWPTELELFGVVQAVRRARQLIDLAYKTVIFTDYSAVTAIAKKSQIATTVSTDRLNRRLISAAVFLSQYPELEILYRPGRNHIAPNALSRLQGLRDEKAKRDLNASSLDDIPALFQQAFVSEDDIRNSWIDDLPAFFSSARALSNYVNTVLSLSPEFIA